MTSSKNKAEIDSNSSSKPVTDEAILKTVKEIVVKFIETGRLSPTNFDETFKSVYNTVHDTIKK